MTDENAITDDERAATHTEFPTPIARHLAAEMEAIGQPVEEIDIDRSAIAELLDAAPDGNAIDREIAQTAAACDAELTHMAKRAVVAEPAGDLVDIIAATIRRVDGKHNMGAGVLAGHIAETVTALFQPQMEAAEGLLRAAMTVLNELDTHGSASNDDWVTFGSAIDTAIAAGLGVRHAGG